MNRRFVLASTIVALAAWVSPLSAQARTYSFGVSGGLSVPVGDLSDLAESGFQVAGHLYLRPANFTNLGFRGDVSYDRFSLKGNADGNVNSLGVIANAIYNVPTTGSTVRPYVLGGLGLYSLKSQITVGSTTVNSDRESKFGLQAGGGLEFMLSGFSTFVEAKFVNVFTDDDSTTWIPITFGFRF
jgi:opacity protein-like surface antigen